MHDPHRSSLDKYVAQAKQHVLLDPQEERALARRWREHGDTAARAKLVLSNLRFVLKIAHEYRGYGLDFAELVQEGNVGLLKAVDRFDPTRELRFISYAVWWIRAMILTHVQRSVSLVRTGTTAQSRRAFFNLRSARSKLEAELQRHVSAAEVADALAISEHSVNEIEQRLIARDLPLDAGAIVRVVDASPSPEDTVASAETARVDKKRIQRALTVLNPRERAIVERRHLNGEDQSCAAIGRDLSVSRERVRQLESRAFAKMRKSLAKAA